jgi:hypothetical protein
MTGSGRFLGLVFLALAGAASAASCSVVHHANSTTSSAAKAFKLGLTNNVILGLSPGATSGGPYTGIVV